MQIRTTKRFDKQFKKQPRKVQKVFAERVAIFMNDRSAPILKLHKLSGTMTGLWSFNVTADIRVIFDESLDDDMILLIAIGSHSELYG